MASKQSGTIRDPSAPPFATKGGTPVSPTPGTTKGTDFSSTPFSQAPKTGASHVPENRPTGGLPPVGRGGAIPGRVDRPQEPVRAPADRVAMRDAGRNGPGMTDGAAALARGGTAGVSNGSPMRLGGSSPTPTSSEPRRT